MLVYGEPYMSCQFLRPLVETMSKQTAIIAADADQDNPAAAELDATRVVYDTLKPLGCEAQTRVLDHVYRLLRAARQGRQLSQARTE